jgi:hypothetical protein
VAEARMPSSFAISLRQRLDAELPYQLIVIDLAPDFPGVTTLSEFCIEPTPSSNEA